MRVGQISILINRHHLLKSVCQETPTKTHCPQKAWPNPCNPNLSNTFATLIGGLSLPAASLNLQITRYCAMKLLEIRTYKLHADASQRFIEAFQLALPLLRESGIDVVAFGQSNHEYDSFYLVRAFKDQTHMVASQDAFYSSEAWLHGPRESLVACIESYLNTLLWLNNEGIEDLRKRNGLLVENTPC
jgi:hypothetical protein